MPWPLSPDGPFWPWFIITAVALLIAGVRRKAWRVPAIALAGEAAAIFIFRFSAVPELMLCTSWLFFALAMGYAGGKVPAFFYALAGLTSGTMFLIGFGLVPFGVSPILIDVFSALALLSVGGGIYGLLPDGRADGNGLLYRRKDTQVGLAARQAGAAQAARGSDQMKAGQ
jgi:hypothetical protein